MSSASPPTSLPSRSTTSTSASTSGPPTRHRRGERTRGSPDWWGRPRWSQGGYGAVRAPHLHHFKDGNPDDYEVGTTAYLRQRDAGLRHLTVARVKRLSRTKRTHRHRVETLSPEEVVSLILHLIHRGERTVETRIRRAVVAVSAELRRAQVRGILAACRFCGLTDVAVIRTIEEPVAALIDYIENRALGDRPTADERVLIYDFGGGTVDVAVVKVSQQFDGQRRRTGLLFEVLASDGDPHRGGEDLTDELAGFMMKILRDRHASQA